MPQKVTSHHIAKACGVSQSTVSMVLNGKNLNSFSDETIQKVNKAAKELGYSFKRSRTVKKTGRTILIFCPVLSNSYYTNLIQIIEQAAYEKDLRTVVHTTYRSPEIELRHLKKVDPESSAGIIFTHIPIHKDIVEEVNKQVPVVVIGDRENSIGTDTIEVNSFRSGYMLAEYLLELGHQDIGFISTTLNDNNSIRVRRMQGIKAALDESPTNCSLVIKSRDILSQTDIDYPNIEHEIGYELALECIDNTNLTALVGVNDMVSYGILDALHDKGMKAPDDYSVGSFDNLFQSNMRGISLTSMDSLILDRGKDAVDLLIQRMSQRQGVNSYSPNITRVEYQPRLIIRNSTGPAKQAAF